MNTKNIISLAVSIIVFAIGGTATYKNGRKLLPLTKKVPVSTTGKPKKSDSQD